MLLILATVMVGQAQPPSPSAVVRSQLAQSLPLIGADRVHQDLGITGAGVGVLVIDDWQPNSDGIRHGEAVTQIVQAVAPGATIFACKLDQTRAVESQVVDCLQQSFSKHPEIAIVNMSFALGDVPFSSPCSSLGTPLAQAIRRWTQRGVLFVAASGNDGYRGALRFPACLPDVISVGATYDVSGPMAFSSNGHSCQDYAVPDKVTCYSDVATFLTLVAPGTVVSTPSAPDFGGTSAAAPLVSGTTALMLSADPQLTRTQVISALQKTAASAFLPYPMERFPRVDAYAAVDSLLPSTGSTASPLQSEAKRYDANNNGLIDDNEFIAAMNDWINGRLGDSLFFAIMNDWITQTRLAATGLPQTGLYSILGRSDSVELYDLSGDRVVSLQSPTLVTLAQAMSGLPVGVYLYVARLLIPSGSVRVGKVALLH